MEQSRLKEVFAAIILIVLVGLLGWYLYPKNIEKKPVSVPAQDKYDEPWQDWRR